MKRFDFSSIKSRIFKRLRISTIWSKILGDGTIGNLIDAIAESFAELARYMEYLLGEKKWLTARNISSIEQNAKLIGYRRQLPQSAIGYILVSHTDENGKDRLANLGQIFFDINAKSDFDDISQDTDASTEEKAALVPWVNDDIYTVPKGTRFIASNNVEFFSIANVSSRTFKNGWTTINNSDSLLSSFYENGAWNGIKYLKIPVIQGIQKTVSLGTTTGTRNECFIIPSVNVEAAANAISAEFFNVTIKSGDKSTTYVEIMDINAAGPEDCVFEKSILKDESGVKLKFGNGVNGKIPESGGIVYVNYIETLGSEGNIDGQYQINTMVPTTAITDPRTGTQQTFLSCTNIAAIQGGKDIEDVDDIRVNAPASYIKNYTISTEENLYDFIMKRSPLNLLNCNIYSTENEISDIQYSESETSITDVVKEINNYINISALLSNGDIIDEDDVEDTFMLPLKKSLNDIKCPNDYYRYVAPNKIELAVSVKVKTSDLDTDLETMQDYLSIAISNEYDIYNQTFYEPLYSSKITSICKSFKFCDSASTIIEAVANVDYDNAALVSNATVGNSTYDVAVIPFSFDDLYTSEENYKGFKDCKLNSDYLLKADLIFINDSTKVSKNRTIFLFDNRQTEDGSVSLTDGKSLPLTADLSTPEALTISSELLEYGCTAFKETTDNFENRQVRVAQFPFISDITDSSFMSKARSFSLSPVENRPYIVDSNGKIQTFSINSVESSLQISTSGSGEVPSSIDPYCYKKNSDYIPYLDIVFDDDNLSGYFVINMSYLGFDEITETEDLQSNLKQYVNLRIYAQPLFEDFTPLNKNDIIFIDQDYIKVEKSIISN